jgi:uncharacterized protein YqjF (DUF2071 family)
MDPDVILSAVDHREQPLPRGPWIMTQIWHELLFAHWPIALSVLRPMIPSLLDMDTFDGEAWIGIVPFRMSNVHPRGVPPVTGLSKFPELNVRTYVTARGVPGVYFFSLDAGNPIAVALARSLFHLPYFNARMRCERIEDDTIRYMSHRTHRGAPAANFVASYRPTGAVFSAGRGSLERWLTERYNLYTVFHERLYCGSIHHRIWPLQPAEVEIHRNTMALAQDIHLPDTQPLLHYSAYQEVLIWSLQRVL